MVVHWRQSFDCAHRMCDYSVLINTYLLNFVIFCLRLIISLINLFFEKINIFGNNNI